MSVLNLRRRQNSTTVVWLSGVAFALFCGCVTYHHEVGSTHVAVLSVTKWNDYVEQLAPGFDVNANSLKAEAVSDSLQYEEALQHSFSGRLGLSMAGGGDKAALLPSATTNAVPTTASPASLGLLALPGNAINRGTLSGDRFLEYLAATALFQEVKLLNRYVMDAAVREGYGAHIVRLQVSNMPYKRDQPFDTYANIAFFMTQITQPANILVGTCPTLECEKQVLAANMTEFAHANDVVNAQKEKLKGLSTKKPNERSSVALESWNNLVYEANTAVTAAENEAALAQKNLEKQRELVSKLEKVVAESKPTGKTPVTESRLPVVVPLLVTDQVEAALVSRKMETLRQLTLSLAAAYAGQGAKLDLEDIDRKMRSAIGRDYNSLFTVARLADNALRLRIGARQTHPVEKRRSGYETVPQTHNVTLLLLVPQGQSCDKTRKTIDVFLGLKTEYRDPLDGAAFKVETCSPLERNNRVRSLVQRGGYSSLSWGPSISTNVGTIVAAAQNGQYDSFLSALGVNESEKVKQGEANRLWLDLVCAHIGSDYDVTRFEVKRGAYALPRPVFPDGEAFMFDDGQTTTATVDGVHNLETDQVLGIWEWWVNKNPNVPPAEHHKLGASSAKLNGKRQLVLTFPSLLKNSLARPGQHVEGILTLKQGGARTSLVSNVTLAKTPDPNHLEILSTTDGITMDKGSGQIELMLVARGPAVDKVAKANDAQLEDLANKKECFVLSVGGAEASIVSDAGASGHILRQMPAGLSFLVAGTGKVKFSLKNPSGSGTVSFGVVVPSESDPVASKNFKIMTPAAQAQAAEK